MFVHLPEKLQLAEGATQQKMCLRGLHSCVHSSTYKTLIKFLGYKRHCSVYAGDSPDPHCLQDSHNLTQGLLKLWSQCGQRQHSDRAKGSVDLLAGQTEQHWRQDGNHPALDLGICCLPGGHSRCSIPKGYCCLSWHSMLNNDITLWASNSTFLNMMTIFMSHNPKWNSPKKSMRDESNSFWCGTSRMQLSGTRPCIKTCRVIECGFSSLQWHTHSNTLNAQRYIVSAHSLSPLFPPETLTGLIFCENIP